jgi:hypothetical protein
LDWDEKMVKLKIIVEMLRQCNGGQGGRRVFELDRMDGWNGLKEEVGEEPKIAIRIMSCICITVISQPSRALLYAFLMQDDVSKMSGD